MVSEKIDKIAARCSALQSLSVSELEDSLKQNMCYTQTMGVHIAAEMSKLQEEPAQQAE